MTVEKEMESELITQLIIDMATVNEISLIGFRLLESADRKITRNYTKIMEQIVNSINPVINTSIDSVDSNRRWKKGVRKVKALVSCHLNKMCNQDAFFK